MSSINIKVADIKARTAGLDVSSVDRIDPRCIHVACNDEESLYTLRDRLADAWPDASVIVYNRSVLGVLG